MRQACAITLRTGLTEFPSGLQFSTRRRALRVDAAVRIDRVLALQGDAARLGLLRATHRDA